MHRTNFSFPTGRRHETCQVSSVRHSGAQFPGPSIAVKVATSRVFDDAFERGAAGCGAALWPQLPILHHFYPCRRPRAKHRAPISGVSTNSCGCALRGVSLQARPARWAARCWHALAAAAIYGFADGASQPLDVLCIQDRKAELIGIFDAYIHPRRTTMTFRRPFPLAMDGNALNVMRSPELENHYTFVIAETRE
jgi:hypothetical protein